MASGDLFEIKLESEYQGITALNVFHYRDLTGNVTSELLNDEFAVVMVPLIQAAMHNTVTLVQTETRNVFDPLDFHVKVLSVTGSITGASSVLLPSWFAASMRMNRQRIDMRHGYKRFTGIVEGSVQGNAWNITEPQVTALVALAGQLNLPLDVDADVLDDAQPVVVKRIKYTTAAGKTAYRLPQNQGEFAYFDVTTATLLPPTTQDTRK